MIVFADNPGHRVPVVAGLGTQRVYVTPGMDTVRFSCNIQIEDADKRNLEFVEVRNSSSCEEDGDIIRRWSFTNDSPVNLTGILREHQVEVFVQDLSVKMNHTVFDVRNQRLYLKCRIRAENFAIPSCTEIFFIQGKFSNSIVFITLALCC